MASDKESYETAAANSSFDNDKSLDIDCEMKIKKTKEEKKEEFRPPPLPEPYHTWRKILKDIWIGCEPKVIKTEICQTVLYQAFEISEDPLNAMFTLHKNSPDYGVQKASSLAGQILKHFESWLQKTERTEEIQKSLNYDIRKEAFTMATTRHTAHLETFSRIFDLKNDDMTGFILDSIKEMIVDDNYRDAIACATYFGLQMHFDIEDLLIPCLLQDRIVAVEAYIKDHPSLQFEFVKYFDGLIGLDEKSVAGRLESFRSRGIMTVPISKVQGKTLEKMVAKWLTKYALSSEEAAPNLFRARQRGCLRHMAYLYFVDRSVTEEGYHDYVSQALLTDKSLQRYYVNYLCDLRRYDDAVRWVICCNMYDYAPRRVIPYVNDRDVFREANEKLKRHSTGRKEIKNIELFAGHPIIMVTNVEVLETLVERILKVDVIGIDSEWKPRFLSTVEQVSIFQLSLWDCTYLVDVSTLEKFLAEDTWDNFFRSLFKESESIKLGFDLSNDLKVLRNTFPFLQPPSEMKNVICIARLINSLKAANPSIFDSDVSVYASTSRETDSTSDVPSSDDSVHYRLTDICEILLGEALDKSEQIGNWAKRPLRYEQMKYAAMDSYCLLGIFEKLKAITEKNSMDWAKHMREADISVVRTKEERKAKKKANKVDEKLFHQMINRVNAEAKDSDGHKRRPKDILLVVDSMLLGLGRHLRRCGIDTVLAATRSELLDSAKKDLKRIILTCGKAADELRRHRLLRNSDRVLSLPPAHSATMLQQVEYVLRRFNLQLTKEDIFSRCIKCNNGSFVIAPAPVLEAVYQADVVSSSASNSTEYDFEKYLEKIQQVNSAEYSGYGCCVVFNKNDKRIAVQCHNGVFYVEHISARNSVVVANDSEFGVELKVENIPLGVFQEVGRFFYVCGNCGKVYWDGCHVGNYNTFIEPLFEKEENPS